MARRPSSSSVGSALSHEPPLQNGRILSSTSMRSLTQLSDVPRPPPARSNTSTSQKLDGLFNLKNDPDELFARHTISEVKVVQQRLRADADAKQEELRLMVGERYRDLLQSSTSILALAKSSKNVLEALGEMRDTVNAIGPARAPKRISTGEDKQLQVLQSMAAHVKLLLDAPEHLWRLMEKKAYLNAAWLCLLARVVHRALSEDDDQSWRTYGIDVMEQFPLVQRQWDTITPFRSQISHRATLSLREASSTPGEVCATLLSLHLLESRPLPETLFIYLAQRTKTLSSMLIRNASTSANGGAKPNSKIPQRSRKVIVRETKQKAEAVLNAISRTVCTARATFADGTLGSPSLMKQALQFFQAPWDKPGTLPGELQLTTQKLLETLPSASQLLLLPQSIRSYKPYIDGSSVMTPTLQPHLQDKLGVWFNKAVRDAGEALADWFASLDSVQEVWDVRDALLAWLQAAEGLDSSERGRIEFIVNVASQQQATLVWKAALSLLEQVFRDTISSATKTLDHDSSEHRHDIRPVEHLFHAPSVPSVLQSGAQSSAAAAQFVKYKASLQEQLKGHTPLLHSALATLERHASDLQKDIATISSDSGEADSELIAQLTTSYRADAEHVCQKVCDMLDSAAAKEDSSLNSSVFIGRMCQELASSSSSLFAQLGCGPTITDALRQHLSSLHVKLMEKWQEHTISHILAVNFGQGSHAASRRPSLGPLPMPSQPSHSLTQALLSLSSELQQLDTCLEDDRRQQQAGSTLRRLTAAYLDRMDKSTSPSDCSDVAALWDLTFLWRLNHMWGDDDTSTSERIDASVAHRRDLSANAKVPSQAELSHSAQEYLLRAQILLAGLIPSRDARQSAQKISTKAEKPSSLLLFGTPTVEQRFEPALELVKTPPRFGLLLVGGATVR